MDLKRYSLFELVDKLYQLTKFNDGSFTLKSGAIKRVFIDEKHVTSCQAQCDTGVRRIETSNITTSI